MTFILVFVFGYFFVLPLLTLVHELAHTLSALLFSKNTVKIAVGTTSGDKMQLSLGRLKLSLVTYSLLRQVFAFTENLALDRIRWLLS